MEKIPSVRPVSWKEVREQVHRLRPDLGADIDVIHRHQKDSLVLVHYAFGDRILTTKGWQPPSRLKSADSRTQKYFYDLISKQSDQQRPVGLILDKISELFIPQSHRIVPWKLLLPGMWLSNKGPWYEQPEVSAGSRSAFLLPNTENKINWNLFAQQYGQEVIDSNRHVSNHWRIFRLIDQKTPDDKKWNNTILLFPTSWLIPKTTPNASWGHFYKNVIEGQSNSSECNLHSTKFLYELMDHFDKTKEKPSAYHIATLKHCFNIAMQRAPGFRPAINDIAVPLSAIERAFVQDYELNQYWPTVMYAEQLSRSNSCVYYSLQRPTLLDKTPKTNKIRFFQQLKKLKNNIYSAISICDSQILHPKQFQYIHRNSNGENGILQSKSIIELDKRFSKRLRKNLKFCATSRFWNGAIRITLHKEKVE